jgi:hypothetical protein
MIFLVERDTMGECISLVFIMERDKMGEFIFHEFLK